VNVEMTTGTRQQKKESRQNSSRQKMRHIFAHLRHEGSNLSEFYRRQINNLVFAKGPLPPHAILAGWPISNILQDRLVRIS